MPSGPRREARGEAATEGAVVTIRRRGNARPYQILIVPLGRSRLRTPGLEATTLALLGDPEARMASPLEVLQSLYGLTRAEARLARSLASGDSLETHAERNAIAISTARWRLKQVQAKTGARRQADLVRLLLTGPASLAGCEAVGDDGDGPGDEDSDR